MQDILHANVAEALIARAKEVLPGGVLGTSTMPKGSAFVPVRGVGSHVVSADGREYIDYTMGSGVLLLGYQPPEVIEALHRQADQLVHAYAYLNQPAIELAEAIVAALPSAEMVRFTASGGEATFYAMRLARAHTRRNRILKFEGAYHGFHDYAIQSFASGNGGSYPDPKPGSAGIPPEVTAQTLVAPFNDLDRTAEIVRRAGGDLAAIIVEPIQRIIEPRPDFLQGLRNLADEVGACLIFDEVVTAFRLGYGGAQERYGVTPDLTSLGKVIGGGLPLAAVCGRQEIMRHCSPEHGDDYVYQSGTMNGHALAAACGLQTLRVLQTNPPYAKLAATGQRLRNGLSALLGQWSEYAQVLGTDSLWQVVFTKRPVTQVADIWASDTARLLRFHDGLIRRGVMIWRGNRSFTSRAHSEEDIATTLNAADDVLREMANFRGGIDNV